MPADGARERNSRTAVDSRGGEPRRWWSAGRRSAPEAGGSRKRIVLWRAPRPKRGAGGNIRSRGVAHDPGASRRSTRNASGFRDRGVGKTRTQTKRAARTEEHVRRLRIILRQGGGSVRSMRAASLLPRGEED